MGNTAVIIQINAPKLTAEPHVIETLHTLITIIRLFQSVLLIAFNVVSYSSIHVLCHYINIIIVIVA